MNTEKHENNELKITTIQRRVEKAQCLVQQYVTKGTSLVDELIAERREAACHE